MSDCPGWIEIKYRQVNFDMTNVHGTSTKQEKNTETDECKLD